MKKLKFILINLLHRFVSRHSLNIGGGPNFSKIGWYNLETEIGLGNPISFKLTPECVFPILDSSLEIVYSSHNLEHLDSQTVERVLKESYRVLESNGALVIKIPDFEKVLKAWKEQDVDFFRAWNMDKITKTWKSLGISDDLDYRAAMIFCGIWNQDFGSPFSSQKNKSLPDTAYHGPVPVEKAFLHKLFASNDPAFIASQLKQVALEHYQDFHFNHQNAWSRVELEKQLNEAGFRVETFDDTFITKYYTKIPGIDNMREISTYCLARK